MDTRFRLNNTHLDDPIHFVKTDPHLKRLYEGKYIYSSKIIEELPKEQECILTLTGGRQVGKTTLLKQWMEHLLKTRIPPESICFYSCELIGDYQSLYQILQRQIKNMPEGHFKYIILDEITYVEDWDKTIKYLADLGIFENCIVVLTGSDSVIINDAKKRFPGRRGDVAKADFHYYPLSFREFILLKKGINTISDITSEQNVIDIYKEFDNYLVHGGFLKAINYFAAHDKISEATLATYSDWIRGDVLKRNKKEHYLIEILGAILKYYLKQVSWDNLVKELSIDHTQTVSDYVNLLTSMDVAFIQQAIIEDKLIPAPKKRKKLIFNDPFIYHAIKSWLFPTENPYKDQIQTIFSDPILYSEIVEATVIAHFRRFYPTYYIKAEGEVDIAYVKDQKSWPVEIKWTNQIRPKDLKQIGKYNNGVIYTKSTKKSLVNKTPTFPLPLELLNLY